LTGPRNYELRLSPKSFIYELYHMSDLISITNYCIQQTTLAGEECRKRKYYCYCFRNILTKITLATETPLTVDRAHQRQRIFFGYMQVFFYFLFFICIPKRRLILLVCYVFLKIVFLICWFIIIYDYLRVQNAEIMLINYRLDKTREGLRLL